MGTKRDYYEILGIEKNADAGKIKSAYRKLAKKYHPDTNSGDAVAEQKFKEVTEAYNVLSDPEKKKLYDQFGHAGPDGGPANSGFYQGPDGSYREYHYQSGDMDDLFGDIFGDLFRGRQSGSFRQGGFRQEAFRQKGGNLHADIPVTFEEAAFGCDKVITLSSPENGQPPQTLKVRIPAGIDSGKSIRLRGKGMPGSNGGEPGDLLLKVSVLRSPASSARDWISTPPRTFLLQSPRLAGRLTYRPLLETFSARSSQAPSQARRSGSGARALCP